MGLSWQSLTIPPSLSVSRTVKVLKLISKDSIEDCMLTLGQRKLKLEQDMTAAEEGEDTHTHRQAHTHTQTSAHTHTDKRAHTNTHTHSLMSLFSLQEMRAASQKTWPLC